MKMRLTFLALASMATFLLIDAQAIADEQNGQPKENSAKNENAPPPDRNAGPAFLGVGVEAIQPALARQMPDLKGRGVIVVHVTKDSPAQKAGLRELDVITGFDDNQVSSPEQLVKLIQSDKPGRTATLEVLRSGKPEKVKVTLGERPTPAVTGPQSRLPGRNYFGMRPEENEAAWESFDSLSLSRLDNKRFKAEISYRDDKGKIEHKKFEGSRQEIREAIEKEKEMPALERDQLLRALNPRQQFFPFGTPGFRFGPQGGIRWDSEDLNRSLYNDSSNER